MAIGTRQQPEKQLDSIFRPKSFRRISRHRGGGLPTLPDAACWKQSFNTMNAKVTEKGKKLRPRNPLQLMNNQKPNTNTGDLSALPEVPCSAYHLPMDLALTRWSVVCTSWGELANGHAPYLPAFLAGWYCRQIGASHPETFGQYNNSFNVGWREADTEIAIASREHSMACIDCDGTGHAATKERSGAGNSQPDT